MASSWIDTHAHLTNVAFTERLQEMLERAARSRVTRILCVGIDAESSKQAVALAEQSVSTDVPAVWASVGIHPNDAHLVQPHDWENILGMTEHPKVCALGETGLDRYWDDCPFEVQQENFARHWQASREIGLPVIIHSRDCDADMAQALRNEYRHGPLHGVMHSFAGHEELAKECLAMGLYISFSGILTYKKNEALRQVASEIPMERLLLETDCPYLSPEPVRSARPNEPALMLYTAEVLASAQGVTLEQLSQATTENALKLFAKMR